MRRFLTRVLPSHLQGPLAAAVLLGLAGAGPVAAQPRGTDLELDLFYRVRAFQALADEDAEARGAFAEELADLEVRLRAAPEADGRLWAGLDWLYRRLGRSDAAEEAWRRARSAGYRGSRPDTVADLFRPPGEREPGVVGRVSLGGALDSNPVRLGEGFPVMAEGSPLEDDVLTAGDPEPLVLTGFRLTLHPLFDARGWTVAVEGLGQGSFHGDSSALDRAEGRAVVHVARGGDPAGFLTGPLGSTRVPRGNRRIGLLFQVGAARNLLDGEDHVDGVEAAGSLLLRTGQRWSTRFELTRSELELDRRGPVKGIAWDETSLGLVQSLYLGRRDRELRLGLRRGERSGAPEVEGALVAGRLELVLPVGERWAAFVEVGLQRDEYDAPESNPFLRAVEQAGLPARDETTWWTSVLAVREIRRGVRLTASLRHEDRDAERPSPTFALDPLSYHRTRASVGLTWLFGREGTP